MHDICCMARCRPQYQMHNRDTFSVVTCFCWLKGPARQKVRGMTESDGSNKSHYLSFSLAQPLQVGARSVQLAVVLGQGGSDMLASSL